MKLRASRRAKLAAYGCSISIIGAICLGGTASGWWSHGLSSLVSAAEFLFLAVFPPWLYVEGSSVDLTAEALTVTDSFVLRQKIPRGEIASVSARRGVVAIRDHGGKRRAWVRESLLSKEDWDLLREALHSGADSLHPPSSQALHD